MDLLVRAVEVAYDQLNAYYTYVLERGDITFEEYVTLDVRYFLLVTAIRKCDVRDSKLLDRRMNPAMFDRIQEVKECLDSCQQQVSAPIKG